MTSRQLNIRLDPGAHDELEVHAFLRRLPAATVARDVILKFLYDARNEPGLDTARQAREEYEASNAKRPQQTVARLRPPPAG
jgi:hypothetical protein